MRVFLIFFVSLLICGCGRWGDLSYQPVSLYQEDDVGALSRNLNGAANAKDYAFEVIQITNYRCDVFFESLDRLRGDSDFALARIAAVSTGLPPILQAAHASATAIANVSAALGFATGTINDYKQYYLLADFKPEIYKKWQTSRIQQHAAIEGSITANTSIPEAKLRLYEYVRMCLPSQLKQWIYESANSSATTPRLLSAPTGSSARALRAVRPGPLVID